MLHELYIRYQQNLLESVIPFWLKHSLDNKNGGYYSCLDYDGTIYDDKKYIWLQGRAVWMFSRLYNEFEKKQEYLDAAQLGIDTIYKHAVDQSGYYYFSLTQENKPFSFQRKPYSAVFCMLGLLEYGKATNNGNYINRAVDLFWKIKKWIENPQMLGRQPLSGQPVLSHLANAMVLASMTIELAKISSEQSFLDIMQNELGKIKQHYDPCRKIFLENRCIDGVNISQWPEGRLFNPGHSIEVAWFVLHMLRFISDDEAEKMAFNAIEGSLELGWDSEFGGIFYFMDVDGKPTLQLESSMKLWWPHTEAIYALVLSFCLTNDNKWIEWLLKVDSYAFEHFVDFENGEWYGYCDRRGNLTHTSKGGNYKGFFHVPRALLFSIQEIRDKFPALRKNQ